MRRVILELDANLCLQFEGKKKTSERSEITRERHYEHVIPVVSLSRVIVVLSTLSLRVSLWARLLCSIIQVILFLQAYSTAYTESDILGISLSFFFGAERNDFSM